MTMCLFWIIMPGLLFQVTGKYLGLTARFLLESFFCYQLLAAKSLCVESMKVCRELKKGDIEGARKAVSMIVGVIPSSGQSRHYQSSSGNCGRKYLRWCDRSILFMAVFGPLGGTFYKAVNTMDSMIGYRNDKYILFGRTAAKLDDVLNFIPAAFPAVCLHWQHICFPGQMGKMPGVYS